MKHSLSLLLLLVCGFAYAADEIDLGQWHELRLVVLANKNLNWGINFNRQYPNPSEAGVRELAKQLDFTEKDMHSLTEVWSESSPEQLKVSINGEPICRLTPGKCTNIICDVRQEIRQSGLLNTAAQQYPFDDADKVLFKVGNKMKVLYSTAFINSISTDSKTTVEKAPILDICESATAQSLRYKQIIGSKITYDVGVDVSENPEAVTVARDRADHTNELADVSHGLLKATAIAPAHNRVNLDDTITIDNRKLLLFLQFGVQGIKRTAEELKITLHLDDQSSSKTLIAPTLLAQFMEKYRAHENHDIVS